MLSQAQTQRLKSLILTTRFWLVLAAIVFLAQAAVYPFVLKTHLDEGIYSIIGYDAVMGRYPLYKEGGPWFTYMPLSFLVPGIVHGIFGKGLYVIRLFSILCGGLSILFSYLIARKLGGNLAALLTLWLLVASVPTIQYYSLGGPVPFVALCLIASVYLLTTRVASPYREVLAVLCVSLALGARQNMLVSWFFLVTYGCLIQKRPAHLLIVAAASVLFPLIIVIPFWPDIFHGALALPQFAGSLLKLVLPEQIVDEGSRSTWPTRAYIGAVFYLVKYYYFIWASIGISCCWTVLKLASISGLRKAIIGNPIISFIAALFSANFLVHVIGPILVSTPFGMYAYFNYYAPLAAVLGGLGFAAFVNASKGEYTRGVFLGIFGTMAFFSVLPWSSPSYWAMSLNSLRDIDFAAEHLAKLTTPRDKIFALTLTPEFLLTGRRPYPALIVPVGLSICRDTERVQRLNRYNFALAKKWLREADVVILSDAVCQELADLYKGLEGSGRDVADLAQTVVLQDFDVVEQISRTSRGKWTIYRKKEPILRGTPTGEPDHAEALH